MEVVASHLFNYYNRIYSSHLFELLHFFDRNLLTSLFVIFFWKKFLTPLWLHAGRSLSILSEVWLFVDQTDASVGILRQKVALGNSLFSFLVFWKNISSHLYILEVQSLAI